MVYSRVLIGSRCFSAADWSNSTFSDSRVMEIKATFLLICFISGSLVRCWLKPLDGADCPTAAELSKLVQSKAWFVKSVVLNRVKAHRLSSTPHWTALTEESGPVFVEKHKHTHSKREMKVKPHKLFDLMVPLSGGPLWFYAPTSPLASFFLHDVDLIPQLRAKQSVFISVVLLIFVNLNKKGIISKEMHLACVCSFIYCLLNFWICCLHVLSSVRACVCVCEDAPCSADKCVHALWAHLLLYVPCQIGPLKFSNHSMGACAGLYVCVCVCEGMNKHLVWSDLAWLQDVRSEIEDRQKVLQSNQAFWSRGSHPVLCVPWQTERTFWTPEQHQIEQTWQLQPNNPEPP